MLRTIFPLPHRIIEQLLCNNSGIFTYRISSSMFICFMPFMLFKVFESLVTVSTTISEFIGVAFHVLFNVLFICVFVGTPLLGTLGASVEYWPLSFKRPRFLQRHIEYLYKLTFSIVNCQNMTTWNIDLSACRLLIIYLAKSYWVQESACRHFHIHVHLSLIISMSAHRHNYFIYSEM